MVDPERMHANRIPPPIVLEQVRADGEPVALAESLDFPPDRENFEFHYTAPSLSVPERVRFRYQLEGLDRDWVEAGTRRVAYYTRIPPGRYRFVVTAANEDGVWNESGVSVAFRLHPHFWRTGWFFALSGGRRGGDGRLRLSPARAPAPPPGGAARAPGGGAHAPARGGEPHARAPLPARRPDGGRQPPALRRGRSTRSGGAAAARGRRCLSCSWTSTRSRPSTTPTATCGGTSACARWRPPSRERSAAPATSWPATAARSSRHSSRGWGPTRRRWSRSGCGPTCRRCAFPTATSPASGVVTISGGVATLTPTERGDPATLVAAADQALYEAKRQGRNRVVASA